MNHFRLLGPVEIMVGGAEVSFDRRQHRDLLVLLLLHADRLLTVDGIVAGMWGEAAPATARAQVANMISAVRRVLAARGGPSIALTRRRFGYQLEVTADQVDLAQFDVLTAQARAAGPEEASRLLHAAVDLWRGPALAGVQAAYAAGVRTALEERRLAAIEDLYDAELRLGQHSRLVPKLTDAVAAYPFRERLLRQLMIALYRCGRQVDALATYREARRRLADQHGLEPSGELQELELRMLRADPALDAARAPAPVREQSVVPRQLPAPARHFVGRATELKDLSHIADDASGSAVVITAIAGTGGVGKTALAVHWAHTVADRFPDGQLYINLRGFDPGGEPTSPAEAIRTFLSALDIPPERIPAGLDAQTALYRSVLAGRRMLLVLDNARDPDQVRPLLPGTASCLVLVTSRNRLTGLLTDGAHHIGLGLLTAGEAHDLLAGHLGPARVAANPTGAEGIVTGCARLPLALAIVASRAAAQPTFPLTAYAAELADPHQRLDALDTNEPATRLRAVFSWSYRQLRAPVARLFRLLGLHPGPDFSAAAAVSLAGTPPAQTRHALAELTDANLIAEHSPGRYALHDLLRAYATELAHVDETPDDRQAAIRRLLDHYLHSARTAANVLTPHRESTALPPPCPGTMPENPASYGTALAWFTIEHQVMLAVVNHAAQIGLDHHVRQLASTLANFFERRGHWRDLITTESAALAAATRLADDPGRTHSHHFLSHAYVRLGRFDEAEAHLTQALDLCRQAGDEREQATTHLNLCRLWEHRKDYTAGLDHGQQALQLFRSSGSLRGQANALNNIGWFQALLGDPQQALGSCELALSMLQRIGDRLGEAATWDSLGYIHHQLGHHDQAIRCYRNTLDLYRELSDRTGEGATLAFLGDTFAGAGDPGSARAAWQQALIVLTDLGHADADRVRRKLDELERHGAHRVERP